MDERLKFLKNNMWILWQNNYGRSWLLEFKNEIYTLSKIEHMNLVKLYGFLEHEDERVIVVEYVGNGNLREHLDGKLQEVLVLL